MTAEARPSSRRAAVDQEALAERRAELRERRAERDAERRAARAERARERFASRSEGSTRSSLGVYSGSNSVGPRPGRWCGWWMRTQKGGGPELNVAWNWRSWGSASGPQVGAVVVWRHHVGMITGQTSDGRWIVKSGNDGGRVRERARSVAGAIFRI